jgi:predicted nucleic acid-binding protein
MILAVDTNILLDILIPNSAHASSSLNYLTNLSPDEEVIVCEVVFAELASQFGSLDDLLNFLRDTGIRVVPSSEETLFEASRAWTRYLNRKKDMIICPSCGHAQPVVCESCNRVLLFRQHILSDFLIGAHAKVQAEKIVTRDRGFYRTYFKGLNIATP